ncbi:MAG: sigma-70 family RNA polymerase sigma factor [Acidobacteria bacterium]|nr:sigma-70 family RNA polymerase sigma factor [Acidobacteriota bacterium]
MPQPPLAAAHLSAKPGAPPDAATAAAVSLKTLVAAGRGPEAHEALGHLMAICQGRALRLAYHYLRDAADADEAVQDAFVKAFHHIDQYDPARPFGQWFLRIVVNAALDRARARRRHVDGRAWARDDAESQAIEAVASDEADAERQLLAAERWAAVRCAVDALPDRQRLVFTLSQIDGQSPADIAHTTGMSAATVRVHLFRALRRVRVALGATL